MADVQTFYVTDGNVVHKTTKTILSPAEKRQIREQEERRKREKAARAKASAQRKAKFNTVFMSLGAIAICAMLIAYVGLCNSVITHRKNVANLESEISDIKLSISAAQSRIDTATDLAEVKVTAMDLGMDYASADQIVYYSIGNSDYMSQYQDIP